MKKIILLLSLLILGLCSCTKKPAITTNLVSLKSFYVSDSNTNYKSLSAPLGLDVTDSQADHYVKPNATFYLHISLDNPEQYEILSLTINNQKYQAFNFEKNSTYTDIVIEYQSGEPGIYYFLIEQIKYVADNTILDAKLDTAKNEIKVAVSQTSIPSIYLEYATKPEVINLKFKIVDSLIIKGVYRFILSKDEQIIITKDLTCYDTNLPLAPIEDNTTYNLVVICYADLLDGNGTTAIPIYNETIRSYSQVDFCNLSSTSTSISYDLVFNIVPLTYSVFLNDTINVTSLKTITGLEPDTNYKLSIIYKDPTHKLEQSVSILLATKALTEPSIVDFSISTTNSTLNYIINLETINSQITSTTISLYDQNNNLISSSNNLIDTFTNLLSNQLYKISFNYTYILDSQELAKEETKYAITKTLTTPTVSPIIVTFSDHIYCSYEVTDLDNVVKGIYIYIVTPYDGEIPLNDINNCFRDLSPNEYHKIIYKIYVDYNDGLGIQQMTSIYTVKTVNELDKIYYDVTSTDTTATITINQLNFSNNPTLKINNIQIKEYDNLENSNTDFIVYPIDNENNSITISDLKPHTCYYLIISYSYDNLDGLGRIDAAYSNIFYTQ